MKTLQTGTKVLIEATVEMTDGKDDTTLVRFKTSGCYWMDTSDLTVCETAQQIDPQNFCIDITDPVNAELLPGFKEWFLKNYDIQNSHHYQYYEVCNGLKSRTNHYDPPHYLTTLPELQKQHPGVFEPQQIEVGDVVRKLNTKLGVNSILKIPRPQPSEPIPTPSFKAGQEVEILDSCVWVKAYYIGPTRAGSHVVEYKTLTMTILPDNIRPIPAQPTVESELRQLYEKAKAIDRYETWKSLATAWHQKHSGRVEVSVPSDEEIRTEAEKPENAGSNYTKNHMPGAYQNKLEGFLLGAKWMRDNFMTRKEANQ